MIQQGWYPTQPTSSWRQRKRPSIAGRPTLPDARPSLPDPWLDPNASVTILYAANAPTPPVPDAFAPDVTSRPEIDGLGVVRVSVVGPRRCKRGAKDGPCRQASDNGSNGKTMMPSSIRRRRACDCTDCDCRANRKCDQRFSHHATSNSSLRRISIVRPHKVSDAQPPAVLNITAPDTPGVGVRQQCLPLLNGPTKTAGKIDRRQGVEHLALSATGDCRISAASAT